MRVADFCVRISNSVRLPCRRIAIAVAIAAALLAYCDKVPRAADGKSDATVLAPSANEGEDWSNFLGPQGDGVSNEKGLAESWPKGGPPVVWEKPIGTGYSAPSVRGDRVVVHHRIRNEEIVECLRTDNSEGLWKFSYPSNFTDPYGYNNGPRCTPLLTDDRCYTHGAEGVLYCLDRKTGKEVWHRDTKAEFDLPEWFFGVGATPILEGELLIVLVGGQPNSGAVAFNAATGKTVWERVGKETWDGADTRGEGRTPKYKWTGQEKVVSYSSPLAVTIHGKRHVLCLMRHGLVSIDPKDGSENFKYWFRSRLNDSVNAARPVVIGDRIFLSAAYDVGSAMLQVAPDGKSVKELWRNIDNMQTHWSTAIAVDDFIYGFSGRHEQEALFRCIDAATGKVVWETTGYDGKVDRLRRDTTSGAILDTSTGETIPFPFFGRGSKIKMEDKFIVLGEHGTLALVKINPRRFEEIARTSYPRIGYPAWAAPVLSRKRLYLRSEESLLCLDVAPRPDERKAASP